MKNINNNIKIENMEVILGKKEHIVEIDCKLDDESLQVNIDSPVKVKLDISQDSVFNIIKKIGDMKK